MNFKNLRPLPVYIVIGWREFYAYMVLGSKQGKISERKEKKIFCVHLSHPRLARKGFPLQNSNSSVGRAGDRSKKKPFQGGLAWWF